MLCIISIKLYNSSNSLKLQRSSHLTVIVKLKNFLSYPPLSHILQVTYLLFITFFLYLSLKEISTCMFHFFTLLDSNLAYVFEQIIVFLWLSKKQKYQVPIKRFEEKKQSMLWFSFWWQVLETVGSYQGLIAILLLRFCKTWESLWGEIQQTALINALLLFDLMIY